jgi:PEGA domain-containing protein
VKVHSEPPGADVYVRDYDNPKSAWLLLGKTPLDQNRLPHAFYAFRLSKDGFETVYPTGYPGEVRLTTRSFGSISL